MDFESLKHSLIAAEPPKDAAIALKAMWWDAKGNWDKAHDLADSHHDEAGNWVHAYLHRKEGDRGNAGYWYRRAGKAMPAKQSLDDEWIAIAKALQAG